jgi:hypothetical protein
MLVECREIRSRAEERDQVVGYEGPFLNAQTLGDTVAKDGQNSPSGRVGGYQQRTRVSDTSCRISYRQTEGIPSNKSPKQEIEKRQLDTGRDGSSNKHEGEHQQQLHLKEKQLTERTKDESTI